MTSKALRWSGLALAAGGLSNALFWISAIPFDTFAGRAVVEHPVYVPGQILHLLSAMFTIFGYTGLYLALSSRVGTLATVAYIVGVIGTLFYLADAAIALVVLPAIASSSPALLEATGPLFTGPVLGYFVLFSATNMIGIVLVGVAAWRSRMFATLSTAAFVAGGILFNLPPIPSLHYLLVAGGVAWGIAGMSIGMALRRHSAAR